MTDHRINLTLYRPDAIMDGDLEELTQARATNNALNGAGAAW